MNSTHLYLYINVNFLSFYESDLTSILVYCHFTFYFLFFIFLILFRLSLLFFTVLCYFIYSVFLYSIFILTLFLFFFFLELYLKENCLQQIYRGMKYPIYRNGIVWKEWDKIERGDEGNQKCYLFYLIFFSFLYFHISIYTKSPVPSSAQSLSLWVHLEKSLIDDPTVESI